MMLAKKEVKVGDVLYIPESPTTYASLLNSNCPIHIEYPRIIKVARLEDDADYTGMTCGEYGWCLDSILKAGARRATPEEIADLKIPRTATIKQETTVELPKDFVLEAHSAACSAWQKKIEEQLPELFKRVELIVGKWYFVHRHVNVDRQRALVCFQGSDKNAFGFNHAGEWTNGYGSESTWVYSYYTITPASDEEVEQALIAEAKRRGYKEGNYKCLVGKTLMHSDDYRYHPENNRVTSGYVNGCANVVFDNGVWAEIIEEPKKTELTLEQIAERFNIPVSSLRIKD